LAGLYQPGNGWDATDGGLDLDAPVFIFNGRAVKIDNLTFGQVKARYR